MPVPGDWRSHIRAHRQRDTARSLAGRPSWTGTSSGSVDVVEAAGESVQGNAPRPLRGRASAAAHRHEQAISAEVALRTAMNGSSVKRISSGMTTDESWPAAHSLNAHSNVSVGSSGATAVLSTSKPPENAADPLARQHAGQIDAWIRRHAVPGGIVVVSAVATESAGIFPRRDRESESGQASPHAVAAWPLRPRRQGHGRAATCPDAPYADGRSAERCRQRPDMVRRPPGLQAAAVAPGNIIWPVSSSARNLRDRNSGAPRALVFAVARTTSWRRPWTASTPR